MKQLELFNKHQLDEKSEFILKLKELIKRHYTFYKRIAAENLEEMIEQAGECRINLNSHNPGTDIWGLFKKNWSVKRGKRTPQKKLKNGKPSQKKQQITISSYRTQSQPTLSEKIEYFDNVKFDAYIILITQEDEMQDVLKTILYAVKSDFIKAKCLQWHETSGGWVTDENKDGISLRIVKKTSDQFWIKLNPYIFNSIANDKKDDRVEILLEYETPL